MAARSISNSPRALSREQCRAADRYAIEQLGVPGVVLMENAGRNAADRIETWVKQRLRRDLPAKLASKAEPSASRSTTSMTAPPSISIVCGKGNNGGDGFVIARHLLLRGWSVEIDLVAYPSPLTGDAAIHYQIIERMKLPIHRLDDQLLTDPHSIEAAAARWQQSAAVVDALLGTGFVGTVREPFASVIEQINGLRNTTTDSSRPLIIAVDVPSGLDADTGIAEGPAIRADYTITFLATKIGYASKAARAYLGRVVVCDIGIPLGSCIKTM
ncbi:MAG: NAD(P)H-hydrate epimerase [Phycisphaerae bacterium]|nr:NAD(P)H-hydrate epimerase [Phycisphaerae bacterium]